MSLPRRILEHATYMITRRCSERRFFLRPDAEVTRIVEFLIAVYADRHGIQILAWAVLSNHFHAVVADPDGTLPRFLQDLDSQIARALNAHWRRGESFWAPGSYNAVELDPIEDEANLIEKLTYVWSNPVAAGLVASPEEWPGLMTLPEHMGTYDHYRERPTTGYFSRDDSEPETTRERLDRVTGRRRPRRDAQPKREAKKHKPSTFPEGALFQVQLPAHVEESEAETFRSRCREALDVLLEQIRAERAANGQGFLGAAAVRRVDPFSAAGDTIPDFGLDPDLAPGRDEEARIARIQELVAWRLEYALALKQWRDGNRAVRFPRGTYKVHVLHGALAA